MRAPGLIEPLSLIFHDERMVMPVLIFSKRFLGNFAEARCARLWSRPGGNGGVRTPSPARRHRLWVEISGRVRKAAR